MEQVPIAIMTVVKGNTECNDKKVRQGMICRPIGTV